MDTDKIKKLLICVNLCSSVAKKVLKIRVIRGKKEAVRQVEVFDISKIEEFAVELEKAARESPRKHKYMLRTVGDKCLETTASVAPDAPFVPNRKMSEAYINYKSQGDIKSSLLKKFMYKGKPQWVLKVEGETVIVGTRVFYAKWVNEGHKIVKKKVKDGKVTYEELGFVTGKNFMEQGLADVAPYLPEIVEKYLDRLLDAAFK